MGSGYPVGELASSRDRRPEVNVVSVLSGPELAYLNCERRLARIATVGADGTPHVVPVGWTYDPEHDAIHPERVVSWGIEAENHARNVD